MSHKEILACFFTNIKKSNKTSSLFTCFKKNSQFPSEN